MKKKLLPTQQGYYVNSASWFMSDLKETINLTKMGSSNLIPMTEINKNYIYFHGASDEIVFIAMAKLRDEYKRNKTDNAKILIVQMKDENENHYFIAKRFNNNQTFRIEL